MPHVNARLLFSSLAVALLGAVPAAASPPSQFLGDVDGDFRLDVGDLHWLRAALDGAFELPADAALRADVDEDGLVTEADFVALTFPALDATSIPPFGTVPDGTPVVHAVVPAFAPPGATVAVEGEGFAAGLAANEVRVGDVPVEVLSAAPDRIEFVVPAETGVVSVTNLVSGRRGLSASFVVAASAKPSFDPSLPAGSVLLVTPDDVPLANDVFLVPLAFTVGAEAPAVFHVRLFFDPEHVEATCVEPLQSEWYTPLPPCIDNAAGVLGAGALRTSVTIDPGDHVGSDVVAIFAVGFEVKTYRAHAPKLVARVEAIEGEGFPGATIGAKTPRYVVDTAQLHAPAAAPPGMKEWAGSVDELPVLTDVTPRLTRQKSTLTVSGENLPVMPGAGGCVVVVGGKAIAPTGKTESAFQLKLHPGMASGPLTLVDLIQGRVSNDLQVVVPEATPPGVAAFEPAAGASFVPSKSAARLCFTEALDGDALTYGRAVGLRVTRPGGAMRPWPAAILTRTGAVTTTKLRPLLPFPAGATVRVEVAPWLVDLSGNGVAPPLVSEFVVAP